jgi:hypothetical protein
MLYMYDGYLNAIRDGSKRSTVRVHDPASPSPIRLVFEHDDNTSTTIHALVTPVESKAVSDLDDDDAVCDGVTDRRELLDALEFPYPGLDESAEVEIAHFRTTVCTHRIRPDERTSTRLTSEPLPASNRAATAHVEYADWTSVVGCVRCGCVM